MTDELELIEITVSDEKAGLRLDSFLAGETSFSRNAVQRLIDGGFVALNGSVPLAKTKVRAGDAVTVEPPEPAVTDIVPQDIPLDIVYQDKDIAVINKPKGMVVHPAAGNPDGTLVNAIMFHIGDLSGIGGEMRPGIVHRIDRMTSGLLVVAKNDSAHAFLSDELKTHAVSRVYYCLCEGNFREDSGTVDAPIGRSRTDRKKMAVVEGGRNAVTHYEVLERFGSVTFLRVELETGRTHQIRVHMAYIKHPLIGDEVYGRAKNSLGIVGQALHAGELRLTHPVTKERMTFTAPLPEEFENALRKLRKPNNK